MNKIYLGDVEIANVGSGGGGGDYVDTSTFAEQTHAAAAALVDLKQKHNELSKLEDALQDQEEALLAEVQAVEVAKADVSAVYMKSDIDKSDKVVAAALASLDDRVSTLEASSGGGGGGGSFDPTDLSTAIENLEDALLDVSTDVADIDASVANHESRITTLENSGGGSFDPTDINSSISDISTRVSVIESDYVALDASIQALDASALTFDASIKELAQQGGGGGSFDPTDINASIGDISTRVSVIENDYVVANDISSFVTQTALDASYVALDASIQALDASALVFDASIKELAQQGGGGGGSDPAFVKYTNTSDSTKVGIVSALRTASPCTSIGNMAVICGNGIATGEGAFSSGLGKATGKNSGVIGSGTATALNSFAAGDGTANGSRAFAFGSDCVASGNWSIAIGYKAKAERDCTYAEGYDTKATASHSYGTTYNYACHAEGLQTTANGGLGSHAEGYYATTYGYGSHAEGHSTLSNGDYSHAEGQYTRTYLQAEHAEGQYNSCSSTGGNTFGSELNTLSTIGNGVNNSSRHNAFEVRQSGDIYISDVSAAGEYYEKPMINLQQKIYELEARIAALEGA